MHPLQLAHGEQPTKEGEAKMTMDVVTSGESERRMRSRRALMLVAAILVASTCGTIIYLASEDESGWDGVFLWAALAAGWGFVTVGFANVKKHEPNAGALWFAWVVYMMLGFGGVFAMTAYWLAVDDMIYAGTYFDLGLVIVTAALMLYVVVVMTGRSSRTHLPEHTGGAVAPGWHTDPTGAHEQRFYDGERWTARVRDGDRVGEDRL